MIDNKNKVLEKGSNYYLLFTNIYLPENCYLQKSNKPFSKGMEYCWISLIMKEGIPWNTEF